MNYIHIALFIGIVACLIWIRWKSTVKEGFDDAESLVYTSDHCPLLSNQMKGYQEAKAVAKSTNMFSSMQMYEAIISELQVQMTAAGCTGGEAAAKVPLALPSAMTAADIEAAKDSPAIVDLTTVPSVVTASPSVVTASPSVVTASPATSPATSPTATTSS